jgi:hypothetical protein
VRDARPIRVKGGQVTVEAFALGDDAALFGVYRGLAESLANGLGEQVLFGCGVGSELCIQVGALLSSLKSGYTKTLAGTFFEMLSTTRSRP